ncbi:hypothetical protein PINS_up023293 [Pythium insidiosum]|nr:hypothetical protein PINS_up023293 [Pythium insidiosum]
MLMDQEWDTRTWNSAKIEAAIETLYDEIEKSDIVARRELATTMLVRLLETREEAVAYVESTISILMNKAFKSLSRLANKVRIYRVASAARGARAVVRTRVVTRQRHRQVHRCAAA